MAAVVPLIVITGPTASGKTGLALALAKKWGGEIICADSRTVYKGMDIGTAKPTNAEQNSVRHWLLDVARPGDRFTAADFQRLAYEAIKDIRSRGKIPFLVGGTGLYIDAVVLNFVFGPEVDYNERHRLENLTIQQLTSLHKKQQILLPENAKNKRYLVRNIEKNNNYASVNNVPDDNVFVFAIKVDKDELKRRIIQRVDVMFGQRIVQETQHLLTYYGQNNEAMTGNIYRIVKRYLDGEIDEQTAKQLCATRDWQLAKRQVTWLKRHEYVRWFELDRMYDAIERVLREIS